MRKAVRLKIWRQTGLAAFFLGLSLTLMLLLPVAVTQAQEPGSADRIYVVCHVDIAPNGGGVAVANKLLQQYIADSRKEPGAVRIEAYVQADRANHFSLVEVWRDRAAFDAHESAAHTKQFRNDIQPMLGSPFDQRLHHLLP